MAAFVLHATTLGGFFVRLPEIQADLGLSESIYGLVLLGMPAGVLVGSLTIPRQIERYGTRLLIAAGLTMSMLLQILAGMSSGAAMLAATQVLFGLAFSAVNVSINVEANRFETATERKIMSRCHGWWAMGFLVSSLGGAGCVRLGVTPLPQFVAQAALMALAVSLVVRPMVPSPAPESGGGADRARRFALPGRGVMLIGAWALSGILLEATTRGWIVIYARDTLGAAESLAAFALPAVVLTQTLGRFAGDGLIDRFGLLPVARAAAVLSLLGTLAVVLAPSLPLALAGCLLIGAGFAITMPQAFSAVGRLANRPAAESVAGFAALATLINFIGPPFFGVLAEYAGLRVAFGLVLPLTLVSLLMARVLEPKAD